jgi:plastocyanin
MGAEGTMRQLLLGTACVAGLTGLADGSAGVAARAAASDLVGRVTAGGKPVADVVVWLEAPGAPREPQTRVLDQRNMQFTPRVMVVPVGSTVELPNNDRVFHNVFSFNHGRRFDLGIYPTGTTRRIKMDRPAVNRLYCNIHPHMAAYIVAVDTPYFALSGEGGVFTIGGVAPGFYTYHAWRSGERELQGEVTAAPETPFEIRWP